MVYDRFDKYVSIYEELRDGLSTTSSPAVERRPDRHGDELGEARGARTYREMEEQRRSVSRWWSGEEGEARPQGVRRNVSKEKEKEERGGRARGGWEGTEGRGGRCSVGGWDARSVWGSRQAATGQERRRSVGLGTMMAMAQQLAAAARLETSGDAMATRGDATVTATARQRRRARRGGGDGDAAAVRWDGTRRGSTRGARARRRQQCAVAATARQRCGTVMDVTAAPSSS
uniref:Uncharacterized protein n=1 Tax=Oryza nivara TaxID=4536 RepID=A0A0E0INQ9_ORYNI